MHELDSIGHPEPLTKDDFTFAEEPFLLFQQWLSEAEGSEVNDANAMALATVGPDFLPDCRTVLLKGFDAGGFVFYTNSDSAKGEQLAANPQAALLFHWKSLRRQVRVRGSIEKVSPEEADAYFVTRPRQSRLGAWASQQSRPLEDRALFEAAYEDVNTRYPGEDIPRPQHWNGYRLDPSAIEFWQDRPFRLHDRIVFRRAASDQAWARSRLYP
ncbi:pyridoxamine 5'-phosphate oxidase [Terrihabitans sp. B22-R8]|uniref:pyridoxamine 5'-phosphate oxidase n=1 Tax=Terrihabitans sp. B22-R8 TaxID=3425128 RepID=UPI00403CA0DD